MYRTNITIKKSLSAMIMALSLIISVNVHAKDEVEKHTLAVGLPIIQAKAEAGDAEYQLKLSSMYFKGEVVELNNEKGVYWLEKSAKNNFFNAQVLLGMMYLKGKRVPRDENKGLVLLNKSLETNQTAYLFLYYVYSDIDGDYGITDYEKGLDMLENFIQNDTHSSEINIPSLQYILAMNLRSGYKVKIDYDRAFPWMLKAAEGGVNGALNELPYMYQYGQGTKKNPEKAFFWRKKQARLEVESGFPMGLPQTELAAMYYCGVGTKRNVKKANYWLGTIDKTVNNQSRSIANICYENSQYELALDLMKILAENGDSHMQGMVAHMYQVGEGVPQNNALAFEWYTKSSENGDSKSTNNLGDFYENGIVVTLDYAKAKEYYLKSIEEDKNEPSGYLSMGQIYELGRGVEQNTEIAIDWYKQSCNRGLERGCDAVMRLSK